LQRGRKKIGRAGENEKNGTTSTAQQMHRQTKINGVALLDENIEPDALSMWFLEAAALGSQGE
jgi:hypothetical protein